MKRTNKILSALLAVLLMFTCLVPVFAAYADPETCEHTWIWVVDTEPTCGEAGVQHQHCPACNSNRNEGTEIPATGRHTWEWVTDREPTCGAAGAKHETCTVCGKNRNFGTSVPATGEHTWDAGVVSQAPTCAREGIMVYTCTACGWQEARAIEKTAHVDADGNGQCDGCGISMPSGSTGVSFRSIIVRVQEFFGQVWERIQKLFTGEYFK